MRSEPGAGRAKMHGELRVASGRYRGRILKSPNSAGTHPMGAREKLALFNMVNVEGARVLDAFAGSGALGIEALSRGAKEVVFVENNAQVARVVKENLSSLGIEQAAIVLPLAVEMLGGQAEYKQFFDVIIADPPYEKFQLEKLEGFGRLLDESGVLVVSSPIEAGTIELPGLRVSSSHTYARARITVLRKS